ncbi:ATP synthase subunit I [Desulfonema ishimotonii]|uniref:ATP synthase subunit I n=1 Tax=Desulfonema ishimotonii TaxID=45657 RepID=A0A401FX06_9BACT|nr:ATP synthase subunit I [Desulfonema ishimotonii]GBC61491.1 ATP synthase subunit I [Desulfonema ishimotonii]
MENDGVYRLLAFLCGALLGTLHFGGLWLTILLMPACARPRLCWYMSFLIRLCMTLAGMWIVLDRRPGAFIFTFGAFLSVRWLISRQVRNLNERMADENQPG